MTPLRSAAIALAIFAAAGDALAQPDQERMKKNLEKKLEAEFLKVAAWITDFDEAKAAAQKQGKNIFAYFTRSYGPCPPCDAFEVGALSEDGFPGFAKDVVLYINITTYIDGRKDDKLFLEFGVTGYPKVLALDPAGKVIGELHREKRTVDGCRELMREGKAFADLRDKAEKGDNDARIGYFPKALKLGLFKHADAKTYYAGLKNVPAEAKKEIDGRLAEVEMKEIVEPLRYPLADEAKAKELRMAAGRKLWEMDQGSRIPGEEDDVRYFYALIVNSAVEDKNIPALEKGLGVLKERFISIPNIKQFIDQKQAVLDKLKAGKEEKKDK